MEILDYTILGTSVWNDRIKIQDGPYFKVCLRTITKGYFLVLCYLNDTFVRAYYYQFDKDHPMYVY